MSTTRKSVTAEELLRMPRDGKRYELVRGVLTEMAPTGNPHRETVGRIDTALGNYSDQNDYGSSGAGEPGYLLEIGPDTVRAADVVWIAPDRIPPGTQGFPHLAPDLAVEVKSPSESLASLAAKAEMWFSHGSKEVWVADPERVTVIVYRPGETPLVLHEDDNLGGGELLPGFTSPVWRLFRRHR